MKLPPYGRSFQPVPQTGVRVAIGPGAWDIAKVHHCPILVLPEEKEASDYDWPVSPDRCALVIEAGPADDQNLDAIAGALIRVGHRFVAAVRLSWLRENEEPYVYFEAKYG